MNRYFRSDGTTLSIDGRTLSTGTKLGAITALAVVERAAYSTEVIVASRIQWLGSTCSILNSISLFDTTTVRPLMHYDVTSGAPVLWISCKTEIVVSLAARVGTGELYAAYGDTIYFYDLSTTNADWTPVLQYPGSVRFSSVFAHASGGLLMTVPGIPKTESVARSTTR